MKKPLLPRSLAALAACALLLTACGGGGGGGDTAAGITPTTALGASSQYEEIPGVASSCSLDRQRNFVRAYLDEVYLFYDQIRDVNPNRFGTAAAYFDALLVRTPDATGRPKDRFSAAIDATTDPELALALDLSAVRRDAGAPLANHTTFVGTVKLVTSGTGRRVGYIYFRDHDFGAQDDLIAAFRQLQAGGAQDLVLDLRDNSGGFLYIAQSAASMVTAPSRAGQVFERLQYNNKRDALSASSTFRFLDRVNVSETQNAVGTPLPQLGLPRLFVLSSETTCSASESIINGLRGIDVSVVLVGGTTCGKPYGFTERDNCGVAYFPIEFEGFNAKGVGGYTAGFQPTCRVEDIRPVTVAPGDAGDPLLAGAITFIDTGACPAGTATGVQSSARPLLASRPQPTRSPWAGRLLLPPPPR